MTSTTPLARPLKDFVSLPGPNQLCFKAALNIVKADELLSITPEDLTVCHEPSKSILHTSWLGWPCPQDETGLLLTPLSVPRYFFMTNVFISGRANTFG